MGIIICGFPGIGKSYFATHYPDKMIDFESCDYEKTQGWELRYVNNCIPILDKWDIVLMVSYSSVREVLNTMKLQYYLVYPDKSLKDEYLSRYKNRCSTQKFIEKLDRHWDDYINSMEDDTYCIDRFVLSKNQYLNDISLLKIYQSQSRCL